MSKKHYTFEQIEELYKRFNPTAMDVEGLCAVVAEDNLSMLNLISKALEKKGFTVHQAQDGLEALKKIREFGPQMVLLDIQMPKVTGLSILEALRRDERFADTPVILVTGSKQKQDIVLAHKLKASGYIVKPFKMEDLLAKIAEVMNDG
ncbi:MAG: response regulator [Planctomycetota bacterium]|jgi:two-component system response regulator RpaA